VKMEQQEKEDESKKTKFYKKEDHDKKIQEAISKPQVKKLPAEKPFVQKQVEKPVVDIINDDEDDLSDLKADEEERLKKILKIETIPVFDSTDIEQSAIVRELNENIIPKPAKESPSIQRKSKQQIENEQRKHKNKERMEAAKNRRDNILATASSKSPVRKDVTTKTTQQQATPRLNTTYKKVPTSNLVQIEKEMAEKRDIMHKQFMDARTHDAQKLMKDIMIDNINVDVSKKDDNKNFMLDLRKTQTITDEHEQKKPKIDLMTKTILRLQREEVLKRAESKHLLEELEERAFIAEREPKQLPERANKTKIIKSLNHYVHLQEPEKLKHNPVNAPLTYSERLQLHQEPATKKPSENEIYKIYGTKRVPGIYKSYTKETPRKVKTYQERVRELRPNNDTTTFYLKKQPKKIPIRIPKKRTGSDIRKGKTYGEQLKELQDKAANKTFIVKYPFKKPANKINTQKRHDLQTKSRNEYKKDQNRFQPYSSPYVEYPDELSPWSMDDNLKHILYDMSNIKSNKKRVNYKDQDQETLADTDDYLQMFYDDEPSQKQIDKLVRDIDIENKDYTESVNIDDLMNIVSLSSESVSFLDWDQIDKILKD
jgi:hypothetical protein